jgi:hypothetical protein
MSANCPIHLIHGTLDEKIPFNSSERLLDLRLSHGINVKGHSIMCGMQDLRDEKTVADFEEKAATIMKRVNNHGQIKRAPNLFSFLPPGKYKRKIAKHSVPIPGIKCVNCHQPEQLQSCRRFAEIAVVNQTKRKTIVGSLP